MAKITFNIATGPNHSPSVSKQDMDKNIEALQKVIDGKPLSSVDTTLLMDTQSILTGIREQLPDRSRP